MKSQSGLSTESCSAWPVIAVQAGLARFTVSPCSATNASLLARKNQPRALKAPAWTTIESGGCAMSDP